jgi:hypothetical protein
MAGCIVRLMAEKDMRLLAVTAAAQGEELFDKTLTRLEIEMAGPTEPVDPLKAELDQEGLEGLRSLAALM